MRWIAVVLICLAGCGGGEDVSRLSPGQKVVTFGGAEPIVIVDYTVRSGFKAVDVGMACVVADDSEKADGGGRKVTIRLPEPEPWVGKVRREDLRPAK